MTEDDRLEAQEFLVPVLVDGLPPDAYVVCPVAVLCRQLTNDFARVEREHRHVTAGRLEVSLVRSLLALGVIVDTAHIHYERRHAVKSGPPNPPPTAAETPTVNPEATDAPEEGS